MKLSAATPEVKLLEADSMHAPPFWHGELAHSFTSVSHRVPVAPYHEISSRDGDSPSTPSDSAPAYEIRSILLAPPPTQRYFTGVVAEGVSGELQYDVHRGLDGPT